MSDFDVYAEGSYHEVINKGLVGWQMAKVHKLIERPHRKSHFNKILEVGAGIGEHVPFVRATWNEYFLTDIRVSRLKEAFGESKVIKVLEADVTDLPFEDNQFDRVLTTCLLPHVSDPVKAMSEIHRVARRGAAVTLYLPCEPGILLRFARSLTTIPKNNKLGVPDPYFYHFREHIHYFSALNHYVLREFSGCKITSRFYPFPFFSWNLNLFKIYQISVDS